VTNFLLPGFGTMFSSCHRGCNHCVFWLGVAQFFASLLIFGYMWVVYHALIQWNRDELPDTSDCEHRKLRNMDDLESGERGPPEPDAKTKHETYMHLAEAKIHKA
jgi:hypothetical protein